MDAATIQAWFTTHVPSVWGPFLGIVAVAIYEILLVKFPATLGITLPSLVAMLPSSSTSSTPAPVTSTNHPVIAALLNVLDPTRVISLLTLEIQNAFAPAPEPATPVKSSAATGS